MYRTRNVPADLKRLLATRTVALKIRRAHPNIYAVWRPIAFFGEIGLPTFCETPSGLEPGLMSTLDKRAKKTDYDPQDPDWLRFSMINLVREPDGEHITLKCSPGKPYDFLNHVIMREILFRASQSALNEKPMCCSLTEKRFAWRSCDARGLGCASIAVPAQLPPRPGCLARALYETVLQGAR